MDILLTHHGGEIEMITRSSLPKDCDFDKDFIALCLSKQSCDRAGQQLKLYIPSLMSDIPRGVPRTTTESIGTNIGILNAYNNRPRVKTHVKTINYIPVTMENNSNPNSNWRRITYYGSYSRLYVKAGSKFQMRFVHGRLSKPVFNTDNTFEDGE